MNQKSGFDRYGFWTHCIGAAFISKQISEDTRIGNPGEIFVSALLHDIGKIGIEENILNKPGKLTEEEMTQMKKHPEIGYRILSSVNDMAEMANYVLAHHERIDGKGYPKGLKGMEIPLQARIIAIADAYDAMTSHRSYRTAMSEKEAIAELLKSAGAQLDSYLVDVFVNRVIRR